MLDQQGPLVSVSERPVEGIVRFTVLELRGRSALRHPVRESSDDECL